MLDFSNVRKMIYFPRAWETRKDPYVVYVIERWGPDWKGNTDYQELLKNKFAFYPLRRCQPYSDGLWAACLRWSQRRQELKDEFEAMMDKGVWKV